jgi:uncharacterized protein
MQLEYKAFPLLDCKSEDGGRFSGYAAAYTRDAYGDRIAPGAFAKSIKEQRGIIPIFLDHERSKWVGFSTDLAEDAKGLYIDAVLSLESSQGADTYALLKTAKKVDYRVGLSIGFVAEEVEYDDQNGRLLKSIELFETSITPFPANRSARIEAFKSLRDYEQLLRDAGCSRDVSKRVLTQLEPFLYQPAIERDARFQRRSTAALLRAGMEG